MRAVSLLPILSSLTSAALINTQFPHLLIPIDSQSPNTTYGTQKTGEVSNTRYTLISFDVPGNNAATTCRLNFHINTNPIKNAPRELSGTAPYQFNVFALKPPGINKDKDTWNSHAEQGDWAATVSVEENGNVDVQGAWFDCPKWNVAQFVARPVGDRKLRLWWFELDYSAEEGGPHGVTLEMHT